MEESERKNVRGGRSQGRLRYISVLQIDLFRSTFVKFMTSTVMNLTLNVRRRARCADEFNCEFKQYFETFPAKL